MSTSHRLEYSKSSKAPCNGAPPCKGTPVELGVLRHGAVSFTEYGETVQWRHWGCVTADILGRLAKTKLERVPGFRELRPEDQARIRIAVGLKRVDPKDVPESARPPAAAAAGAKRKAADAPVAGPSGGGAPRTRVVRIDEDIEEVLPEEEVKDEMYVMMRTNVVGIQYYEGLVGPGEEVTLVREPTNKYDRNAIKVVNIGRNQVGHIPREVAARLAPLMDRREITVEGVMHEGNLTGGKVYTLSMTLKIYGPSDKRNSLEPKLIWATPGQRGFAPRVAGAPGAVPGAPSRHQIPPPAPSYASGGYPGASMSYSAAVGSAQRGSAKPSAAQLAAQNEAARKHEEAVRLHEETMRKQQEAFAKARELQQILNNLEKVDDEGRRTSLLDTLCSTEDVLALPVHANPPGIQSGDLKVNLLKHQSQALQWCMEREYPQLPKVENGTPVQFWQLRKMQGKPYYYNVATKTPQNQALVLGRGALCADSMGLGKTLTMLALILATKTDVPVDHSRTTLIVVPLSVLSNWEKQIEDHVKDGALTHCVYYGTGRNMSPEQLKKYDVVITTYQIVAKEHGESGASGPSQKKQKTERALFDVRWKRIVLDEGHTIRNSKTKMAKAVCGLVAQRRWVLTGTPIINSPADLGSILKFLQICAPLDNEDFYRRMVLRPLKDADPAGVDLMKALMSSICIRRTKEMQDSEGKHLVPLPPVDITVVKVTLADEARELYDAVDEISKERVGRLIERHGGVNSAVVQSNVLSMLTRLRQLALHPGLVPPSYLEQLKSAAESDDAQGPAIQLSKEDKLRLQGLLAQAVEDNEECPICFGILDNPRITSCSHMFCLPCITEVISRDPKCPMDRRPITMGDLIEALPPTELTQAPVRREEDEDLVGIRAGSSAKIEQLIHLLKLTPSTEKSLVFSQFTSFMDKIAESLEAAGIPYVRFDGSMSAKRRQETIAQFSVPLEDDESPAVMFTQAPPARAAPSAPAPAQTRSTRSRRKSTQTASQVIGLASDNEQDEDFVMNGSGEEDDDFIVDEDEDERPKKGKGKGKAKGKGKTAAKRKPAAKPDYSALDNGVNPKVMLISLKAGALGLNLTVANNVYLMDPWWQEGIESQAIDRCNRIGQTKPVHVYQLIAEDTVEAKVLDIQDKKKKLVEQAFSGIKRKETQRQKKEARLQELVELFGLRDRGNQTEAGGQRTLDAFAA